MLEAYQWPGNVRELQNVIERAVILCESDVLSIDGHWLSREAPASQPAARQRLRLLQFSAPQSGAREPGQSSGTLQEIEREAILRALRAANWMVGGAHGAARILGLKRTTLQGRMRRLGITHGPQGNHGTATSSAISRHPFVISP